MSMHFERKKETGSPAGSQGLSHKRQRPVALSPTFRCWSNTRTGRALSWWGKPGGGGGGHRTQVLMEVTGGPVTQPLKRPAAVGVLQRHKARRVYVCMWRETDSF